MTRGNPARHEIHEFREDILFTLHNAKSEN